MKPFCAQSVRSAGFTISNSGSEDQRSLCLSNAPLQERREQGSGDPPPRPSGPRLADFLFLAALQELRHEGNVDYGQAEGLNPRQSLLVSEGGHFPAQLVKRLV